MHSDGATAEYLPASSAGIVRRGIPPGAATSSGAAGQPFAKQRRLLAERAGVEVAWLQRGQAHIHPVGPFTGPAVRTTSLADSSSLTAPVIALRPSAPRPARRLLTISSRAGTGRWWGCGVGL